MANPSVTYTFSNSTTADATQVNSNFTDIINALTDGTKDITIGTLSVAGTCNLNGNINLGNASGDTITVTGTMQFATTPQTDAIAEKTAAAGVTIDGVLLKDSQVTTDTINEKTGAAGVTIDGLKIKDSALGSTGTFSLSDDTATSFTAPAPTFLLFVGCNQTGNAGFLAGRVDGSVFANSLVVGANTVITTGVLSGTTGTDGKFTISCHTDGKVYLENRRGSTVGGFYLFMS